MTGSPPIRTSVTKATIEAVICEKSMNALRMPDRMLTVDSRISTIRKELVPGSAELFVCAIRGSDERTCRDVLES